SSDRIHRHNRVRNLVDRIAQEGMLSPIMEKKHILGDVDVDLGMCLFHFGGQTRALPSMWRSLVPSPLPISTTPSIARLTLRSRNTLIMMKASKVLALSSWRWSFETTGGTNEEGLEVPVVSFCSQASKCPAERVLL